MLDTNYNPGIANGAKYDVAKFDTTGASSGQAPIYNGTAVAWATPAVAPGAIALADGHILVGDALGDAQDVAMSGDISIDNTGATTIANSAVTNAKVSASAAIDFSKLATLTSGNILVGSAGNVATSVAMSGDATIIASGALTIAAGAIDNAKVNAAAAIDFSKLAALPSAQILVGSAGNVATAVAMSGDVAISNTGATTIQAASIDLAMLSSGITPSHVIKFAGQPTTAGGAAAEAITVTGALATDLAFVQMVNDGTNNVTIVNAVVTNNTLTVTFSADPGNDAVINYQIIRAAA